MNVVTKKRLFQQETYLVAQLSKEIHEIPY